MNLSIASILAESASRHSGNTAVVSGSQRIAYRDLWREARQYAAVFAAHGLGEGDAVAIMAPNTPDFVRAYYGALAIGAIVVPVHLLLVADEVQHVLADSAAKLLVCSEGFAEGAKGAQRCGIGRLELERLSALAAQADPVETYVQRDASEPAVILYTSGTTGKSKGAVLTNLNLVMNASIAASDLFSMTPDDVVIACLPLFHAFGQTVVMNASFRAGASIVLVPRFTGAAALDVLIDENVTIFAGVPTMYVALLEAAKSDARRPALRLGISGGSSLLLAVLEDFERVFEVPIYEGYGLSETSPIASFNQDCFGRKPGTVGCGIWGVDLRIAKADVDDAIEFLEPGEVGEVVIRGHCVFQKYLNLPDATGRAIVDGWFRSGDLGTQDVQGFVTIVDRKKDMVLRGGFNVYPREVEEVLVRHPAVAQVAVIGIAHPVHGEEVVAVVVRDTGAAEISGEELIEWSKGQLARYKYPRFVHFVESLPLGPSGKVLKRELVGRFTHGA